VTKEINRTTDKIRYFLLSFLSFLISLIGYIGLKLAVIAVAIGIALLTENYIGGFGLTIGYLMGLVVGGILLFALQRLSPYLEKLDDYTKTYKRYPYTEKYGRNYPHPTPENFGITQAEFKDYNSRFQFEFIKLIFTYGLWIAVCIYVIQEKIKGSNAILFIGGAGMVAILLNYLFDHWNKMISQKHCYYEKIHEFQKAMHIYFKIRDENSNI
jgi:hypothetical protein